LAKDGIYINDYPRTLELFPIPSGGRADIMVKCNEPGRFKVNHYGGELMFINSMTPPVASMVMSQPLTRNFRFPLPPYLTDLRNRSVTNGCSCQTKMDSDSMNGLKYDPDIFIHTVALGAIVEREIIGIKEHPYHQHVYPFQLQILNGIGVEDAKYFKVGDYHDSVLIESLDRVTIRWEANAFDGRMAVHCHKIAHSDEGMLAAENIVEPKNGGVCQCSPLTRAVGFPDDVVVPEPPTMPPTEQRTVVIKELKGDKKLKQGKAPKSSKSDPSGPETKSGKSEKSLKRE